MPSIPPLPPMPDLSNLQLPDLSNLQLPDLSNLQLPDLSNLQLPDLSNLRWDLQDFNFDFAYAEGQARSAQAFARAEQAAARAEQARARVAQYDGLYDQARSFIEQNQYDRAIANFDRVIVAGGTQVPGAMYWKAYSLAKLARRPDALTTLGELQKQFPKSPWVKDAQALELEVRQASGQSVSAESQPDDELKLLALRALMQSDPETGLPVLEKMLSGPSSIRVKDRALFVVSQSGSTRARAVIMGVAKGNANPDLQLKAIRYLGQMGGSESVQGLEDIYRSTAEERVKREILRGFGAGNARDKLLAVARSETSADLRSDAVRYLGNMNASNELEQLYRSESSSAVKRRIVQAIANSGQVDKLAAIAKSETDVDLKRSAIRALGNTGRANATDTLTAIYASDQSEGVRKAVIEALANSNNGAALVALARSEKNPALKQEIVRRLGNMRSPEARQYLLELLQ
jgi:HEAT repeat protein